MPAVHEAIHGAVTGPAGGRAEAAEHAPGIEPTRGNVRHGRGAGAAAHAAGRRAKACFRAKPARAGAFFPTAASSSARRLLALGRLSLNDTWLAFVPPACVLLIFVLSFFTWHATETTTAANFWALFWSQQLGHFIAYFVLMVFCFPLVVVAVVVDQGWVLAPPQLAPLLTFKYLIIGLLLSIAFLLLCYDYMDGNFLQKGNPIAVPMKIAIRLHFLAVLASFLMFWLHWRKKSNLPLPKCEVRW